MWYRNSGIWILSRTGIVVTENSQGPARPARQRGAWPNDSRRRARTLCGVGFSSDDIGQGRPAGEDIQAQHLSALREQGGAVQRGHRGRLPSVVCTTTLFEGVDGPVEDQLMAVGSSLLRTLLRSDVRSVEAMVMADKTNQNSLSMLHYEAGPAHVIAQSRPCCVSCTRRRSERALSSPVRPFVCRAFQRDPIS